MTWMVESPLLIVILGLLVVLVLGGAWIQTGRKPLLYAAITAGIMTALLFGVERFVQTDREQVRETLNQIARDVESNDVEKVLAHVYSGSPDIRSRAASEFPLYQFKSVSIKRNLKIIVEPKHFPPKAVAEFNVVVSGTDKAGLFSERAVPRFAIVTFYKEDNQWRVRSYEHRDPQEGFMNRD
jgi:hypothetical protein